MLLSGSFIHSSLPGAMGPANKNLVDMSQMSEEELLQFQQEVNTQIEEFVRTLPEEEQKQFYKDVEELSQIMSTMSEEELMQFMDQVLTEEQQQATQPSPTKPATEVMPAVPEEKPKPVEVKQPTTTTQPFLITVETVLDALERFLLKAQIIPELSGDMSNWVAQGKIKQWQALTTWSQFQEQINMLVYSLKKLKERDPQRTQLYRYLGYVDDALQKVVQDLAATLNNYEPKVEAPAFGLGKISKQSRAAIQQIIDALGNALYTHQLLDRLDKVFKSYGPREQELTKMEEERQKKALEGSKTKASSNHPLQQVGSGLETGFVAIPATQQLGGESGYAARYTEPFAYHDEYSEEPHRARNEPSSPAKRTDTGIKKDTDTTKDKKLDTDKEDPSKTKQKDKKIEDKKADLYLKTIERQLDKILELYDTVSVFKTMQTHIRGTEPINPTLVEAVRSITIAATRAVDQAKALTLHSKNLSKKSSEYYIDELKDDVAWYQEQLEPFVKEVNTLLADESQLFADRRYAYFGNIEQKAEASKRVKDLDTIISEPASLQEMVDALQELYDIAIPKPKKTPENPYGIEKPKTNEATTKQQD